MLEISRTSDPARTLILSGTANVHAQGEGEQIAAPQIEGYDIIGPLGQGGMGTVWRALQQSTRREVALKVLQGSVFKSPRARFRFEREVEVTARLEHPHIARIYDSGVHEGHYYYAMEFVDGVTLDAYVRDTSLGIKQVAELIRDICQTVNYAHQKGIIHRDLKPGNILVTPDRRHVVLDFGLAKPILEEDRGMTISLAGETAGTPAYMSPEQAAGDPQQIDTRSDIYALGVILYQLLTGQWPYPIEGTYFELLKARQENDPVRPSVPCPGFDRELEAILMKALARKPDERYATAGLLAQDIDSHLNGRAVQARSYDGWYVLWKAIQRHRTTVTIGTLLLAIVIGWSFFGLYSLSEKVRAEQREKQQAQRYRLQAEKNARFAHQALLDVVLSAWHQDERQEVQFLAAVFQPGMIERPAIAFLLDERPLSERAEAFAGRFAEYPGFLDFLVAEAHLKAGRVSEAIAAFKSCLAREDRQSELDDYYMNRAWRQVQALTAEGRQGNDSAVVQ